jgi:hypothetical protein
MTFEDALSLARRHPDFNRIVRAASGVGLAVCAPHAKDVGGLKQLPHGLIRIEDNLKVDIVEPGDPSIQIAEPVAWRWEPCANLEGARTEAGGSVVVVGLCCAKRERDRYRPPKPAPKPVPLRTLPVALLQEAAQLGLGLCAPHGHEEDGTIAPLPAGSMALEQDSKVRFATRDSADARSSQWIAAAWRWEPSEADSPCEDTNGPSSHGQAVPIYGVLISSHSSLPRRS